jgi:hypothetical protein
MITKKSAGGTHILTHIFDWKAKPLDKKYAYSPSQSTHSWAQHTHAYHMYMIRTLRVVITLDIQSVHPVFADMQPHVMDLPILFICSLFNTVFL